MFVATGDAYTMDRGVQVGYEHSVPKTNRKHEQMGGRRVVAILRQGSYKAAHGVRDSGKEVATLEPKYRWDFEKNGGRFGHLEGCDEAITDEKGLDPNLVYSREQLVETGGHNQAQRGVSGAIDRGAEPSGEPDRRGAFETPFICAQRGAGAFFEQRRRNFGPRRRRVGHRVAAVVASTGSRRPHVAPLHVY